MPTPRVPTSILEARGAYKKNPQRAKARENEPVITDPIGPYPESFVGESSERTRLRAIWDELVADAADGVLNRSHRMHLEATCRLMLKVRGGYAKTGDFANLNKFLTQMGMNPAAQSTVRGAKKDDGKEDSVFGQLASTTRGRRA
jgi:hypothetical protein